ncbi:MAG: TolC family protein [Actinobacteria bacterium]|nr:TolC family protein [Actinomycetota bacterium]
MPIKNKWWKNFNEPQLNILINEALKNNLNYKIAVKNIQIARTYVSESQSYLLPQANINFSITKNKSSKNSSVLFTPISTEPYHLYQVGINASYEIPIWNQAENAVNQAQTNLLLSREDADVVKLALLSNVSQTYFQLCALSKNIKNLNEQYLIMKKILDFYNDRYKSGLIEPVSVEDTKILLEDIKYSLTTLVKLRAINQNALAYYLGKYPENIRTGINNKYFNEMDYTKLVPVNLPSEILIQRPDVKASLDNVYSYAYAEKESLANMFPVFSLTGSYGFASTSLADFITNSSSVWDFGLNVFAPLFNYNGNYSKYERAKIQYQQAVLSYRNTVLNAFSETDNVLASYKTDFEALSTWQNNYHSTKKIFELYTAQYHAGIIDPITYLTWKFNLLNAQYNLVNQNLLLREDIISIYNALGMGLNKTKDKTIKKRES